MCVSFVVPVTLFYLVLFPGLLVCVSRHYPFAVCEFLMVQELRALLSEVLDHWAVTMRMSVLPHPIVTQRKLVSHAARYSYLIYGRFHGCLCHSVHVS